MHKDDHEGGAVMCERNGQVGSDRLFTWRLIFELLRVNLRGSRPLPLKFAPKEPSKALLWRSSNNCCPSAHVLGCSFARSQHSMSDRMQRSEDPDQPDFRNKTNPNTKEQGSRSQPQKTTTNNAHGATRNQPRFTGAIGRQMMQRGTGKRRREG